MEEDIDGDIDIDCDVHYLKISNHLMLETLTFVFLHWYVVRTLGSFSRQDAEPLALILCTEVKFLSISVI